MRKIAKGKSAPGLKPCADQSRAFAALKEMWAQAGPQQAKGVLGPKAARAVRASMRKDP